MRIQFLLLVCIIWLASCKPANQEKAVVYNNNLVLFQRNMGSKISGAERDINQYAVAKDSAKLFAAMKDVLTAVSEGKGKLNDIKFSDDDFGMKQTLNNTLTFLEKTYSDDYPKWMGAQLSAKEGDLEVSQKIQEEALAVQKKGAELDAAFLDAQKKFAKKYNIMLK